MSYSLPRVLYPGSMCTTICQRLPTAFLSLSSRWISMVVANLTGPKLHVIPTAEVQGRGDGGGLLQLPVFFGP